MLQKWINGATAYSIRHAWLMIAATIILAGLSAFYVARHFAIDTDINDLLSAELP
jgi:predicted RND superfamily exporter protein